MSTIFTERETQRRDEWKATDDKVRDGCRYRKRDERGMREGGATTVGDMPQIINGCQML